MNILSTKPNRLDRVYGNFSFVSTIVLSDASSSARRCDKCSGSSLEFGFVLKNQISF